MITIMEIFDRSVQGMTRPFLCRAGDGLSYYVKGAYAGKRSLCCEWVAGSLAQVMLRGLPVGQPDIRQAEVPRVLIEGSTRKDIRDLGAGTVFASKRIEGGDELEWYTAQNWPEETQAALLLLDLWLQNEDRSLSSEGGNPNLLVTQQVVAAEAQGKLWAYDFNLAFDEQFDRGRFMDAHVFGGMVKRWPEGFRERMESRLQEALGRVRDLFKELPLDWLHLDGDESLPVQLDVEKVISVLSLPFTQPELFWKLP
jgi:hypothetical protein